MSMLQQHHEANTEDAAHGQCVSPHSSWVGLVSGGKYGTRSSRRECRSHASEAGSPPKHLSTPS